MKSADIICTILYAKNLNKRLNSMVNKIITLVNEVKSKLSKN